MTGSAQKQKTIFGCGHKEWKYYNMVYDGSGNFNYTKIGGVKKVPNAPCVAHRENPPYCNWEPDLRNPPVESEPEVISEDGYPDADFMSPITGR